MVDTISNSRLGSSASQYERRTLWVGLPRNFTPSVRFQTRYNSIKCTHSYDGLHVEPVEPHLNTSIYSVPFIDLYGTYTE